MSATKEKSSAQLSQNELHQLKFLLGNLLAMITLWTVAGIDFAPLIPLSAGLLIVGLFVVFPKMAGRIPAAVLNLATPAIIAFVIIDFILHYEQVLEPLLRMVVILILYRCLHYRIRREDFQLQLLCLFALVVSGVLLLSLGFGIKVLFFTPVAMVCLLVMNLLESSHGKRLAYGDWVGFSWGRFLKKAYRSLNRRMFVVGVTLYLAAVGISAVLFVAFPRIEINNRLAFLQRPMPGLTGFSDRIQIGDVNEIVEDYSIALSIEPPSRDAIPADPYWRMVVLDEYRMGQFYTSKEARELRSQYQQQTITANYANRGDLEAEAGQWQFYLEGNLSAFLPLLGPFEQIRFTKVERMYENEDTLVYSLLMAQHSVFAYQLTNMAQPPQLPATDLEKEYLDPKRRQLSFSEIYPPGEAPYPLTTLELTLDIEEQVQLADLVKEIRSTQGSVKTNIAYAEAASSYLARNFTYDFRAPTPPLAEGKDPILHWLREGETGWCEYFAGSLVMLCRGARIPARVVTGFRGGNWNAYEDYLVVRNRNAHAWVEIYDQGYWKRIDPTPSLSQMSAGADGEDGALLAESGWNAWLDSLRMVWYRSVISFDESAQTEIASKAKETARNWSEQLRTQLKEFSANAKEWFTQGWDKERMMKLGGILAAALALVLLAMQLWRNLPMLLGRSNKKLRKKLEVDPIRKKAGHLLRRFPDKPESAEILAAQADLLVLRYDRPEHWHDPKKILRSARAALRQ